MKANHKQLPEDQHDKSTIQHGKCKKCDWIMERRRYRKKEKAKNSTELQENNYFVESPPEEGGKEDVLHQGMRQEEEIQLVVKVQNMLSIKRGRMSIEEGQGEEGHSREEE